MLCDTIGHMTEHIPTMAIETSGRIGSVVLAFDDRILDQEQFSAGKQQAGGLLPVMERLVRRHQWQPGDIRRLFFSAGPGSFTGIRIAVTVAKTLAFAQATQVVAVPTLHAMALSAQEASERLGQSMPRVATVLDAQRGHVYAAVFETCSGGPAAASSMRSWAYEHPPGFQTVLAPQVIAPAELMETLAGPVHILGDGLAGHPQVFTGPEVHWLPEQFLAGRREARSPLWACKSVGGAI